MEVLRTTGNLNSTKLCLREKFIPHGGGNLRKNRQKLVNAQEIIAYVYIYTGCPRRKGQNFGRVFLMLKYNDITQNTYMQS